jgi:DNA polymerase (family 10)
MSFTRQPDPPPVMPEREGIPNEEALALGRAVMTPILPLLAKDDSRKPRAAWTGSIRRKCELVNDIDCVILPLPGKLPEIQRYLFNVAARVICRGEVKTSVMIPDGKGAVVQLDVWFARDMHNQPADLFAARLPSNWGALLLYSTGSKEHNVRIAKAAKAKGWHWNPMSGLELPPDAAWPEAPPRVISQTEEKMYEALGMAFIKPWERC